MKMKKQNLCDSVKAMIRGKFIGLKAYIRKEERYQVNNLSWFIISLRNKKSAN